MFSKMIVSVFLVIFISFINGASSQGTGSGTDGNLRLCIVEGRGKYKRAPIYCPTLDKENSGVECVVGVDRLDCLRRISKGTVDFGVFSPEDLIAAQWANIDVLVTNELRLRPREFARSIVAVVNRRILPDSSSTLHAILKGRTLCHSGVGMDDIRSLSEAASGYLESLVLERSCEPGLSHTENRLKSLAGFYGKACKAGQWVPDKTIDQQLKREYPSLCAACSSSRCSDSDRYYGDVGSLNCLQEGAGDVTWGDIDDMKAYFKQQSSNPSFVTAVEDFAFLCRDGTWKNLTEEPCVWLRRPWNVIVAKRKASEAVAKIAESLTNRSVTVDQHWRGALTALLESNQALPEPLHPPKAPLDYLQRAEGFREAYSQHGCDPPRHITLCTTSLLAKNKCEWLSEAGAVYGVAPPLQCAARSDTRACLAAAAAGDCDAVVADSDWLVPAIRDFGVTPILHEVIPILEQTHTIVAYIINGSGISKMADLRGKRAAFPRFDGVSWHSVKQYITEKENISCQEFTNDYFGEVCAPGLKDKECYEEGEEAALTALLEGKADVAFISMVTYNMFKGKVPAPKNMTKIIPLCPEGHEKYCVVSWCNIGHVFTAQNLSHIREQEIINVFTKLDQLFGKRSPFHNPMFSMYGVYNHQMDIIFHNRTWNLATDQVSRMHPYDKMPVNFERILNNVTSFECSFGAKTAPSVVILVFSLVAFLWAS